MGKFFLKILLISFSLLLIFSSNVFSSDLSEKLRNNQEEQVKLQKQIEEAKNQERTLRTQIVYMDNQIKLTALKIEETEEKLNNLEIQIENLTGKIQKLEESLDKLSELLLERIAVSYKHGNTDPLILLFSSKGFPDFILRLKYLKTIQLHDKKLLLQMETTKGDYKEQKQRLEITKKEVVALKRQLEGYKNTLNQQRKDKERLLEITKNDEIRFQQLLSALRAEQETIERTISQALVLLKDGTPIEKGAEIALMGNTGAPYCSSGEHLHFEVRKNNAHANPAGYLKPDSSIGKAEGAENIVMPNFTGEWDWPINNPKITQEYGETWWTRLGAVGYKFHTGIDMIGGKVIRAPKSGTIYKGSTTCGSVAINYVAIDHGEGLFSWYWHVQ